MISPFQKRVKDIFDFLFALTGLVCFSWLILLAYLAASFDTKSNGFFRQTRVGKDGKFFKTIKIRTMRERASIATTVTTRKDPRITALGHLLRSSKIDELPQLINVLFGEMSFVGPRPDVPGFADQLKGEDRLILSVRPGITGPASLKYRNEEEILATQLDPEKYNREVIFPDKVKINREYVEHYSFWKDIQYILKTILN